MVRRIVLHIGTHKTGTTSIQQFLHDENDRLLTAVGARYPETGWLLPRHQPELPLVAMRPERQSPARIAFPQTLSPAWVAEASRRVRETGEACEASTLVYSHESLSWLRSDDELERLRTMLPEGDVTVVVFLRNRREFLRSYRAQFANLLEAFPNPAPGSFLDMGDDSWLLDYDVVVGAFRRTFGDVVVVDYDATVAADGSVLPRFAELVGADRGALPDLARYFLRRSA